jgi:hypothetical protein
MGDFLTTTEGGGDVVKTVAASGSAQTIDLTDGNFYNVTLTANCTFTFAAVATGRARWFTLQLSQDGTGGRVTTWPGSVTWIGGSAPTLITTAGTSEVLTFYTLNGGTTWIGSHAGGSALTVEDEGTPLATDATTLDFVGAGVTASGAGAQKTITIPGVTEAAVRDAGRWEVVVSGTAPPVAVSTPADDDWIYGWVSG